MQLPERVQSIEPAAHVGRLGRQPDPRALRMIERAQTRQSCQAHAVLRLTRFCN